MPDDGSPPLAADGGAATVRLARPDDLDQLAGIEQAAFSGDRLSRRSLRALISTPTADLLVASVGDRVAGYTLVLRRSSSRIARLYSLAVDRDWAGRGIGAALLAAAENAARAAGSAALRLEVRADNARALRLYRRNGYRPIGARENYYEDGATALRFERDLSAHQNPKHHPAGPARNA
jgi:ribosomal-protein-alanine acetyltransferase